jgi:hypothetical protein
MRPLLASRLAAVALFAFALAGVTACEEMNPAGPGPEQQIPGPPGNPLGLARTITGEVREVDGPPLADVRIGMSMGGSYFPLAKTASDGSFRLEQFAGDSLMFDRPGYASVLWTVPSGAGPKDRLGIAIRIQPWLFVSAAAPLSARLTDDDARFTSGDSLFEMGDYTCHPCKMAIVSDSSRDPVTLRLTWTGDLPLSLWVGDGYSVPSLFTSRSGANEITAVLKDNTYVSQVLVGVDLRRAAPPASATASFTLGVER